MSVYQTARSGLGIRATGGLRLGDGDVNQLADALLAGKRVALDLLGGEAIYSGGAAVLGDITTGTQYPAVTLVVADDAGNLWPFKTTSATDITFNVTSTASGEARLYAVPALLAGVSPAAADGRYNQITFVCDDVANSAPAHSLLLGTGTVTASALTAYTAADLDPATPKLENQALHGWPLNASSGYDVTLSYSNSNRQVTITPTGATFDVWTKGIKRTKTGAQTSTAHANTTGIYYVYYDANGTLTTSGTSWDLEQHVPVAEIYYSSALTDALVFNELHTAKRSPKQHESTHNLIGAKATTGWAASTWTPDTDDDPSKQITIAAGVMYDEDIKHTLGPVPVGGKYTVLSRTGAAGAWTWTETATLPFVAGTYLKYNLNTAGTWSLADAASGDFINYWAFAVPTLSGVNQVVFIPGQVKYSSQAAAEAALVSGLDLGTLPSPEFAPLYRMTYKLLASYSSTGKCRLMSVARQTATGASLTTVVTGPYVAGPVSSTDGNLASFDGTTGKAIKDTAIASTDVARLATAQTFTARKTFTNGLYAVVADAKFGPPASGTYAVGDRWRDAACSEWVCTSAGTPGTWSQCYDGAAGTWTGGGATDITTAANWNGGALLNGYRVTDSGTGLQWTYDSTAGKWLGNRVTFTFAASSGALTGTTTLSYLCPSDNLDYYLEEFATFSNGAAGTWDGSNYWTIQLRIVPASLSGASAWSNLVTVSAAGYAATYASASATVMDTSAKPLMYVQATKTGSPGNLTVYQTTALVRAVRK